MADNDEFRAAIAAYLRAWDSCTSENPFPRELMDEGFEQFVDAFVFRGLGRPITKMFRMFHDVHGRYPTFAELNPPGGLTFVPVIPDIK